MATLEVKFWWLTSENKQHPQVGCVFFRTIASGGKTLVINSINENTTCFGDFCGVNITEISTFSPLRLDRWNFRERTTKRMWLEVLPGRFCMKSEFFFGKFDGLLVIHLFKHFFKNGWTNGMVMHLVKKKWMNKWKGWTPRWLANTYLFWAPGRFLPSNFIPFFPSNAGGAAGTSVAGYLAHLLEEEGGISGIFGETFSGLHIL